MRNFTLYLLTMKFYYLAILFLVATSCNSKDKNLIEFNPVNLEENGIALSKIANDINYIPLDNNFPIGLIHNNLVFTKNSIYFSVLDIGILEFNRDGKFIRKIGSIGKGPGEYTYYVDFSVDDKTGTIYVRDRDNIVKVYSKTGSFQNHFSLKEYGNSYDAIMIYNSKLFVSCSIQYGDTKYDWIILDTLGILIKKKSRSIPTFTSHTGGLEGIYKFDNKLYYWNHYTDTIFSIFPDLSEKPSFIISPGEHRLPRSRVSIEKLSQYMKLENIFETKQFLAIKYFFSKDKNAFALIDKEQNITFLTYLKPEENGVLINYIGGIKNDLDGGINFLPKCYITEDGSEYLIGLIYPYQIKSIIETTEFKNSVPLYSEKKNELVSLSSRLTETDNPILMMIRLRK